jgi:hypothetical protein
VYGADGPDDLGVAAFMAAWGGVSLDNWASFPDTAWPYSAPQGEGSSGGASANQLSNALKIPDEAVAQVFDIDDEGVHLVIQRSKLDDTKKKAQQEVAYLILAARRIILREEWTSIKVIADLAHEMGVHDSNFSKGISAIGGDGVRIRGDKARRELKINQVGIEKAATIITRITDPVS